jgi:hypothetical protein
MIYSSNNLQNIFGTLRKHIISSTKTSYYQHLEQQQKKPKIIAQLRAFLLDSFYTTNNTLDHNMLISRNVRVQIDFSKKFIQLELFL